MNSDRPLILLVEDEEHLAEGLLFNLEAEGYRTHHEADGDAALAWLLEHADELAAVLLDVMLPGRDGFSIVRALRRAGRFTPVLLLTAMGRSEDVVEGFAAGADDYVTKPFTLDILLVRLQGLLRRVQWAQETVAAPGRQGEPPSGGTADVYPLGERTIDFAGLQIFGGAVPVRLTIMEAELLRYLLERPGQVVSRREILENVWRVHEDTDTRAIDNFIVRLRRYIEAEPGNPLYLQTVRGIGYRFVPPMSAS